MSPRAGLFSLATMSTLGLSNSPSSVPFLRRVASLCSRTIENWLWHPLNDLLGHKLKVLLQRVELKDYIDIAALLKNGADLERGWVQPGRSSDPRSFPRRPCGR